MKSIVSVVDWYGPYTLEQARQAAVDFDDGIYLAIGKQKWKHKVRMQYVGLASSLPARLNGAHHKLPLINRDLKIWLGEVASPRSPGKKVKVTDRMLDLTEWAHCYFLQLPLNAKKKARPPDRAIMVYNRWWKTDGETACRQRPNRAWPDLIDYLGQEYPAKLVWFGGRQRVDRVENFRPG
ncbi:hypothetical protein K4L06_09385 [Lysobacter sp. BMK333-48F3]|uniref:hypothetical protein n=1 Tax=Lysobacter sp. BMK333-48F3 TaxID=2867962 RepID=UPI001C8C011C|nr:hypothetical protein [Lysobacter sp. BMK333-48F3]MBX9401525.1 hypothetical protein [Lysobacter sp. BMK333-48F3]